MLSHTLTAPRMLIAPAVPLMLLAPSPPLPRCLCSGERSAAVQPAGLTVQLRPYQLQSLAFMLEHEQLVDGYRDLFWVQGQNSAGKVWWYSPSLEKLCHEVPRQPRVRCGTAWEARAGLRLCVAWPGMQLGAQA